ncbi:YidB family protein [Acinetobacter faecalis]|uniref:YidB family protein n=1 Tax=Acinetobacter faecalis TaxID=2665161 RepID=UPI002A9143AF|nr:YidB family protein [Acinetobacter faecalis]MDY6458207.1 YidB family protein [Acinetobacter faecalis]
MTNLNNIIEILAKQALGGGQQQNQDSGFGGILGSVLGQLGGKGQQSNSDGLGGILGSVLGQFGGQSQGSNTGGGSQLLIAVLPLVLAWVQKQGGLQGALDSLKGQGLTSQVEDWVSTGEGDNATVDPQQIQSLFSDTEIEQVAQQAQAPKQDVISAISTVLPQIIDSLTPQGEQTSNAEANSDIANVMNLVSGFLKK